MYIFCVGCIVESRVGVGGGGGGGWGGGGGGGTELKKNLIHLQLEYTHV